MVGIEVKVETERSKVLPEYLGEDYCRYYAMVRRAESEKYQKQPGLCSEFFVQPVPDQSAEGNTDGHGGIQ